MPETILLALFYAKIKKYNIRPLFKSWTIYPVIIFEIMILIGQIVAYFGNYKIIEIFGSAFSIYLSLYMILILKYELYIQAIIGSAFVVAGGALNDIAIKANDGFMPVFQSLSYYIKRTDLGSYGKIDNLHIVGGVDTKMKVLTDYIDLGYTILSIGDVLIRVFVFIVLYYFIKKINLQERN